MVSLRNVEDGLLGMMLEDSGDRDGVCARVNPFPSKPLSSSRNKSTQHECKTFNHDGIMGIPGIQLQSMLIRVCMEYMLGDEKRNVPPCINL